MTQIVDRIAPSRASMSRTLAFPRAGHQPTGRTSGIAPLLWLTALALAALLGGACSSDKATGPNDSTPATPAGSYTLNTIDAKAMPYTMFSDTGYTLEVSSGSLTINSNGKWVAKLVTKETVVGNVSTYSDSSFGTWSVVAGATTATLVNTETGLSSSATWTASDVTVHDNDGTTTRTVIYKKN